MFKPHCQHARQTHNKSFENLTKIKYFGMTVSFQGYNHKQIKKRLNLENAA
jgi:hypothetical protein